MRVAVIGATGHVGGYLVPRLVRAGHEVVALTRARYVEAYERLTGSSFDSYLRDA